MRDPDVTPPLCPRCGAQAWHAVEVIEGGTRTYRLDGQGWSLEKDNLDLLSTTFRCTRCNFSPDAGDDLWNQLNEAATR